MVPQSTQDYLTQLYNAFCRGKGKIPEHLIIFVSPEFYDQYSDDLVKLVRYAEVPRRKFASKLLFKSAQIRASGALTGTQTHLLEDEVVCQS